MKSLNEKLSSSLFINGSIPLPNEGSFLSTISEEVIEPNLLELNYNLDHLVEILNKKQTPLLCGYSLGGRILLSLLEKLSYKPSLIVFFSSALPLGNIEDKEKRLQLDHQRADEIRQNPSEFFTKWYRLPMWALNPVEQEVLVKNCMSHFKSEALLNSLASLFTRFSPGKFPARWNPGTDKLKQLKTLYFCGENDLKYCSEANHFSLVFKRFEKIVLANTGHKVLFKKDNREHIISYISKSLASSNP